MTRISKRTVDAILASDRDQFIWDEELSGFGLKVTPKGRKVYLVQYRIGGRAGRTRRLTIGVHGAYTPDQARKLAKSHLGKVAMGIDPAYAKDEMKKQKTLGDVALAFLQQHADVKLKKRTAQSYRSELELHLPKEMTGKRISDVTRHDIARLHHSLRDTPCLANRIVRVLSKMFNWADGVGICALKDNPCRNIQMYKEVKRERFLSQEELARLGEALSIADVGVYQAAAIRLLLFTGARLNEILTLRWDWVDIEARSIRLPDSKTGAKSIYLNAPALDVLANLPKQHGNPFVICGAKQGAHLVNLQKPWRKVRALAGLEDVRLHDLRHTFASVGAAGGASLPIIGGLLGHTQPSTTQRYAHLSSNPMLDASEAIARVIDQSMKTTKFRTT